MISHAAQMAAEIAWDHHIMAQGLTLTRREETRHAHGLIIGARIALCDCPDDAALLDWIRDSMSAMEQHNSAARAARRSPWASTGKECA